jgi:hypothetical protein
VLIDFLPDQVNTVNLQSMASLRTFGFDQSNIDQITR